MNQQMEYLLQQRSNSLALQAQQDSLLEICTYLATVLCEVCLVYRIIQRTYHDITCITITVNAGCLAQVLIGVAVMKQVLNKEHLLQYWYYSYRPYSQCEVVIDVSRQVIVCMWQPPPFYLDFLCVLHIQLIGQTSFSWYLQTYLEQCSMIRERYYTRSMPFSNIQINTNSQVGV